LGDVGEEGELAGDGAGVVERGGVGGEVEAEEGVCEAPGVVSVANKSTQPRLPYFRRKLSMKKRRSEDEREEGISLPIEKRPANQPSPTQPLPLLPDKVVPNLPFLHKDRHRLPCHFAAAVAPELAGDVALHARGDAGVDAALYERGVLGAEEGDDGVLACEGGEELGGWVAGGDGVDGDGGGGRG